MIGGLIIATMVCIALSGFCFIGNQYDLLPSFILDAGHYEFVNVLYCLFAIASFLCALIAYRLYKREKNLQMELMSQHLWITYEQIKVSMKTL